MMRLTILLTAIMLTSCSMKVITVTIDYVPVKDNTAKLFNTENTAVPQSDEK